MVNFNNESTIGTPAVDVVRILILQSRANLFEAWEDYRKKTSAGIAASLNLVWARLHGLFDELQAALKRIDGYGEMDYEILKEELKNSRDDEDKLLELTYTLNNYLDYIRLTRLDTKKTYNRSNFEEENKEAGI